VKDTVCLAEDLPRNVNYRIWVRGKNTQYTSDWTAVCEAKTGQGFPERMEGTFLSRWPVAANGGSPYYMDGYQIGKVRSMRNDFPFNKTKFADPKYNVGLPAFMVDAGITRDLPGGAPYDDDDQYVLYHFGGFMGIVRAVLEWQPREASSETDYTVLELFGKSSSGFTAVKFTYRLDGNDYLRGVNSSHIAQLTPALLRDLGGRNWDAGVAYPCYRLGYSGDADNPAGDPDADFHPQLLRPESLALYLMEKLGVSRSEANSIVSGNANRWNEDYFPLADLWDMVDW
jgi:hypothetical protein